MGVKKPFTSIDFVPYKVNITTKTAFLCITLPLVCFTLIYVLNTVLDVGGCVQDMRKESKAKDARVEQAITTLPGEWGAIYGMMKDADYPYDVMYECLKQTKDHSLPVLDGEQSAIILGKAASTCAFCEDDASRLMYKKMITK